MQHRNAGTHHSGGSLPAAVKWRPGEEQLLPIQRVRMSVSHLIFGGQPDPRPERTELLRRHRAHEVVRLERLLAAQGYTRATEEAKQLVAKAYSCSTREVERSLQAHRAEAETEHDGYVDILIARKLIRQKKAG